MKTALRYWHTLRHLKRVQLNNRLYRSVFVPRPQTLPAPDLRQMKRQWVAPIVQPVSITTTSNGIEFCFLGRTARLDEVGWNGDMLPILWRYNQHYFHWLAARDADTHDTLIARWIADNPPANSVGWEPYPTSLRIVSWVRWAQAGNPLDAVARDSLALQARWLARRVEWHLLANHLFANAKALIFAGLFFEGAESDRWLRLGARILRHELSEQILPDGGHFERSPMYHALILEDILDLINMLNSTDADAPLLARLRAKVAPMLRWLGALCHSDGDIAFFNDAAFGIAPDYSALADYATRLGLSVSSAPSQAALQLADSGYVRLATGDALLLADCAPIGPDYQPGHAHADTLSFEFSLGGERIFVNSGTSEYGVSAERTRQRGTAAHNSVVVAGQDSSEVWGGFRVARRARPYDIKVAQDDAQLSAQARHDGYRRVKRGLDHKRCWTLAPDHLTIADRLTRKLSAQARYHLHPDIEITQTGARSGHLRTKAGQSIEWRVEAGRVAIEATTWHPRFGVSIANQCLCVTFDGGRADAHFIFD